MTQAGLITGSSTSAEETEFERPPSGLMKLGTGRLLIDGSNGWFPLFAVTLPFVDVFMFVVSLMKSRLIF